MLRISSFPLSVSFTLTLLFLTPPPPLCFSHPLPMCLSLVLPLSFLHFTILFLSPSRCFKAHITPFSLSISPSPPRSPSPELSRSRLHVCVRMVVCKRIPLKIYICFSWYPISILKRNQECVASEHICSGHSSNA